MVLVLWVGLGGFIGTVFRYLLGLVPLPNGIQGFPIITLFINLLGSFLIGLTSELLGDAQNRKWALFLQTGLCGGFTTFSAFSLETLQLLRRNRILEGTGYAIASVVVCLLGAYAGLMLGKALRLKARIY